jgi:hypothetical protein
MNVQSLKPAPAETAGRRGAAMSQDAAWQQWIRQFCAAEARSKSSPRPNTAGTSSRVRFSSQEQPGGQNVAFVYLYVTGSPRHRHATRTAQSRLRHPRRRLTTRHHPYRWPHNPGARPRHVPRTSFRRRTPRPAAYPHLDADHWQDASIRRADTRTHRTRTHRLLGRRPLRANRDAHSPRCNGQHLHHLTDS